MKNKVYVERYAERLKNGDQSAVAELCECFVNEYNAQLRVRHVYTHEESVRLLNEVNRKGNDLADMIAQKTGVDILRRDWFGEVIRIIKTSGGSSDENT